MSHFTKIKTKIYDLEILKKSLTDLNLEFTAENLEINGYNNQKHQPTLLLNKAIITILVSNGTGLNIKW